MNQDHEKQDFNSTSGYKIWNKNNQNNDTKTVELDWLLSNSLPI